MAVNFRKCNLKRFVCCAVILCLISLLVPSLSAADTGSASKLVYDNASILTSDEVERLEELAAAEGEKYGISIVILTQYGINHADPMYYAADFYDYGGFLPDGVIMFLEMYERDWRIVATGSAVEVITDYDLDYIGRTAVDYFSDGRYEKGFKEYINIVSSLYYTYNNPDDSAGGVHELRGYDSHYGESNGGFGKVYYAVLAAASVLIAFIVCQSLKSQLNTAVRRNTAGNYLNDDASEITVERDQFMYSRVTKVVKEEPSSNSGGSGGMKSFTSSSGTSHSGGGGKF